MSNQMNNAVSQVAYLVGPCCMNRTDACSDAAQYYGLNENDLYAFIMTMTPWSLKQYVLKLETNS